MRPGYRSSASAAASVSNWIMVSKTRRSSTIRKHKHRTQGRKRKNALANHGTTVPAAELFKVQKEDS